MLSQLSNLTLQSQSPCVYLGLKTSIRKNWMY